MKKILYLFVFTLIIVFQFMTTAEIFAYVENAQEIIGSGDNKQLPDISYNPYLQKSLVVWEELDSEEGWNIYGHILNENGIPVGEKLKIGSTYPIPFVNHFFSDQKAKVACTNSNNWVVVWLANDYKVVAKVVYSDGSLAPDVCEISGSAGDSSIDNPDIGGSTENDEYLIVWEKDNFGGNKEIIGQRYSVDNGVQTSHLDYQSTDLIIGDSFDYHGGNDRIKPSVNQRGQDFFVAWEKHVSDSRIDIEGHLVPYDVYENSDLNSLDVIPLAEDSGINGDPSVAQGEYNNDYLVVWYHEYTTNNYNIEYAFTSRTSKRLNGIVANSTDIEYRPAAVYTGNSSHDYLVLYAKTDLENNEGINIYGKKISDNGILGIEETVIATSATEESPEGTTVGGINGKVLVTWNRGDGALYDASWYVSKTYTVSYNANNATSGSPPCSQTKLHDESLILSYNTGNLARKGYTFAGWNTNSTGTGTSFAEGGTYTTNASVTLYAKWTPGALPGVMMLLLDDPKPPSAPSAPTPTSATSVTTNSFQANWNSVSGATGYYLDVSTDDQFGSFVPGYDNLDVVDTSSQTISGLTSGTTYYYRVLAYNAGGTSGESKRVSVTTVSSGTVPDFTNSLGMDFILVEPGTFMMGSPTGEPGRSSIETLHQVTLTQGFYMQTTEVTQGQWQAVMGSNPASFSSCGDDCPVENVSWNDVQDFITALNAMDEGTYRLPTEAEWEYAARAGATTPFAFGDCLFTSEANYNGNNPLSGCPSGEYLETTLPVASFVPNAWGLYDMHGNVMEWCQDWLSNYPSYPVTVPEGGISSDARINRGGGWASDARDCRSAARRAFGPDVKIRSLGFRLVRSQDTAPIVPTATPASNITTNGFQANWDSVSGATGYYLDVSTDDQFRSFVPGYDNLDVGDINSQTISGLSSSTPYYYRVRAYNDGGTSGDSDVISVTTASGSGTDPDFTNSLGMDFVYIQKGTFMMGSLEDELFHQVTLTQGFYMQATEVTQGQWKALMGNNPSYFSDCGDDCPLERVSWNDAQAFITALNAMGQGTYRLPTEAEWEYTCRAGTTTRYAFGECLLSSQANFAGNCQLSDCPAGEYRAKTIPVASFAPNVWGLYNMHGNVMEWCQDWYGSYPSGAVTDPPGPSSGFTHVSRGGHWTACASSCQSGSRYNDTSPDSRSGNLGFRLVLISDQNIIDYDKDGYSIDQGDCDDNNPDVNPGAVEICDDGIDNNCDNIVDECDWVFVNSIARELGCDLYDVDFSNKENGWVVGGNGGTVLKTTNGGDSWEVWTPDVANLIFNGVDFVDENVGWIVGTDRHIYKTTNGGNSWSKHDFSKYSNYNPDYYYHFTSITALSSTEAWVTGYAQKKGEEWGSSGYVMLHTTNGGNDWQKYANVYEGATLNDCFFLNENEGWMVGDRGLIFHTSNGGQNWDLKSNSFLDDGMTGSTRFYFKSVYFTSSTEGWVSGRLWSINSFNMGCLVMFHTVDGGATWNSALPNQDDGCSGRSLNSITFGPGKMAWAVGQIDSFNNNYNIKNILGSNDKGINWNLRSSCPDNITLNSVKIIDSEGWAVGLDGVILNFPKKCPLY